LNFNTLRPGKLAVLSRNSNVINIYSIKNINNSLNASVIEDKNAPTQLTVDKISSMFLTISKIICPTIMTIVVKISRKVSISISCAY